MYSSKIFWEYILKSTFELKNGVFLSKKVQESTRFGVIFVYFNWLRAYLPPLTPSTTTRCPSSPPTNSRCTKQFLSHLHGL
jgi:hypothetical protein